MKLTDLTKKHESRPRNQLIADIFFMCRWIEQWGRRTLDMIELCKQAGNPVPKFEETTGSFWVILPLRESIPRVEIVRTAQSLAIDQLSDRQKEILKILKHGPLNREQIIAKLSNAPKIRMVQLELAKLKKLGLISSKGKGPALVWMIH